MLLFGFATIIAGVVAQDGVVTALGVLIVLIGLALFAFRQVRHQSDAADATAKAGIVTLQAPSALVAVVVGVVLVLIGRGALTLQATNDDAAAPAEPSVAVPTPTVVETTTTTVVVTTTMAPPVTDPNPTVPDETTSLPMTGGTMDLLMFGVVMVAGGRWVLEPLRQ